MIHSSIDKNWMRLEIMISIVRELFNSIEDSDFRHRMMHEGEFFPFSAGDYTLMNKEACMIDVIVCWSVITLESLANHILAEGIEDRDSAIKAIENPRALWQKKELGKNSSDLAARVARINKHIHNGSLQDAKSILDIAQEIAGMRNSIVHDKPFDLTDLGEGEVNIKHLSTRGIPVKRMQYEDLKTFFSKCDKIKDFILHQLDSVNGVEPSFSSLVE